MEDYPRPKYKEPPPSPIRDPTVPNTWHDCANTTSVGLLWAIPVSPVLLGAHLEVYIKLLPTFTALRLCWRFGKGPRAFVHRLPIELVKSVEDILTAEARVSAEAKWEFDFVCFEGRCQPVHHVSDMDWEQIYGDIEDDTHYCDSSCSREGWCPQVIQDMNQFLLQRWYEWDWKEEHRSIQHRWYERFVSSKTGDDTFFQADRELLRKNFGLEIFATHQRSTERAPWGDFPRRTTMAYLHLPARIIQSSWNIESGERGYGSPFGDYQAHTFASEFSAPPTPSAKAKALFPRAMSILGLEPMRTFSRGIRSADPSSSAAGDGTGVERVALSDASPALLMLVKNVAKAHNPP